MILPTPGSFVKVRRLVPLEQHVPSGMPSGVPGGVPLTVASSTEIQTQPPACAKRRGENY